MRFGVLGPVTAWTADGRPVPVPEAKVRALLADLLAHAGAVVSADRLIDDLWGDDVPANPAGALQLKVSRLRQALERAEPGARDAVRFRAPGYVLEGDTDAAAFRDLTDRARRTEDPRSRAVLLADALALWRGPAFADFADAPFVRPAAARLEEERLAALEEQAEVRLALGEHRVLAGELADLVARHPLRERLRAAHMRALYHAGRPAEALRGYGEFRERLAEELGLDPGPELRALHEAILRQDLRPPVQRPRSNLPAPVAELVGREEEVRAVRESLGRGRLVTLTGPGGVGKTRLAVEVALQLTTADASLGTPDSVWPVTADASPERSGGFRPVTPDAFPGTPAIPDGAWLADLAGLKVGAPLAAVVDVVAAALGVRDDAARGTLLDQLLNAVRAMRVLLVLDNCEHVIEPVAELAALILRSAPGARILATSQEPLALPGELVHAVPPLDLPDAVRLLLSRVPGATFDPHVEAVCRRLDGLPLALELAATRMRTLGARELAERLDDRFRLLSSGSRGTPPRHQTLRAMIDWSWDLLPGPERTVLRRLAVHADGCTLDAAREVGGADVVDVLPRLVDRSLVTPGPRHRLLESVRAYCLERLAEHGELEKMTRRHALAYTRLAERAAPELYGPAQRMWLERLDVESANLRLALESEEAGARLARALGWYWVVRGRLSEARRWLERHDGPGTRVWRAGVAWLTGERVELPETHDARETWFLAYAHRPFGDLATTAALLDRALAQAGEDRWVRAAALAVRATMGRARGDLEAARRDAEESMALFRRLGDRWGQLRAIETLSVLAEIFGRYGEAARLHREGLRIAEDLELWVEVSHRLSGLGRIALLRGELADADDFHERARRLAATQGDEVAEEFAEIGLALSARRQGRLDAAEAHLTRWLDFLRGVDGEPGLALVLAELGFVAEERGDAATALEWHREGLAAAERIGDPRAVALAYEGLAGAESLAGRREEAARLLERARRLRESVGAPLPEGERRDVARILRRLGE
ncbi:BTAD domain-containing putative transcriptional regulator [Thermoactinospora rubra]|uniref:BTAD domain-containing putative transcriptional regulator n=1 Tax=Thermoactinospora rubra TaxID=1088767 RepID=UPI000A121CC1|nr:BTAD domain-containing putative transcriptional regulator [Thermoactinospora rubra]